MVKLFLIIFISLRTFAFECPTGFLCGSGCGLHESEADASARAQIAKMFKTKITSNFHTITSGEDELNESFVYESIEEEILSELDGVVIKERKNEDGETCAQAVLNISLFSKRIKEKISKLLVENTILVKTKRKLIWEKVRVNNSEVNHLKALLGSVDINSSASVITVPKSHKRTNVKVIYKTFEGLESLQKLLESRMERNGIFSNKKGKKSLEVDLKLIKETLNIKGFHKYRLEYELLAKQGKKNLGKAFGKISNDGRSKDQVIEKIYNDFKKIIPEIFVDINI